MKCLITSLFMYSLPSMAVAALRYLNRSGSNCLCSRRSKRAHSNTTTLETTGCEMAGAGSAGGLKWLFHDGALLTLRARGCRASCWTRELTPLTAPLPSSLASPSSMKGRISDHCHLSATPPNRGQVWVPLYWLAQKYELSRRGRRPIAALRTSKCGDLH